MFFCSSISILMTLAITFCILLSFLLLNCSLPVQEKQTLPLLKLLKMPQSIDEQTVENCL